MHSANPTPSIFDASGLTALKRQAKANDPAALKAAAQQFEALFLQMVLKSMRDATPKDGPFDSDQTRLYESLLDQQMSQVLAARGSTGLAALIEKQLARQEGGEPAVFENGLPLIPPVQPRPLNPANPAIPLKPASPAGPASSAPLSAGEGAGSATSREFVTRLWPHALEAQTATGIPARFLVAHAALETGWGRAEPRHADGRTSYNVFGIKAGRNWTGATVEATTTEYVDGVARQGVERFRAYGSYAEAFRDYARLMASQPRYAAVRNAADPADFAQGLQRAGYATDPAYGDKLMRILSGPSLHAALAV